MNPARVTSIAGVRRRVAEWRRRGESVGLVPTMGALHAGHRALIDRCRATCDRTVVSIFVNPTQFGPHDDFRKYPRTLRKDTDECRRAGVDLVFAPRADAMYPRGFRTAVRVGDIATRWEGAFRPGHFDGVATVVLKLFSIVAPDVAVFGRKDYQQSVVIKQMVTDLNLPVRIVVVPTVREADGLALSSRNTYLDRLGREAATGLYRALCWAKAEIARGRCQPRRLQERMRAIVEEGDAFSLDYVGFCDRRTLTPLRRAVPPLVIVIAATCRIRGDACNRRFIDNMVVR